MHGADVALMWHRRWQGLLRRAALPSDGWRCGGVTFAQRARHRRVILRAHVLPGADAAQRHVAEFVKAGQPLGGLADDDLCVLAALGCGGVLPAEEG